MIGNRRQILGGLTSLGLSAIAAPAGSRAQAPVPQALASNLVAVARRRWNGHDCLAVELTDEEQALRLRQGQGGGNRPSIAIVHRDFADGVVEAMIGAELTGKGAPDDRGFAGLSFHIGEGWQSHETVYLRMTNGRLNCRRRPRRASTAPSSTSPTPASTSPNRAPSSQVDTRRAPILPLVAGTGCGSRSRVRGCALWSMASRCSNSTTCATRDVTGPSGCLWATALAACLRA